MSDFNVSVPDLESIPEADINDRIVSGITIELPIDPALIGPVEDSEPNADEWVNSLILENSSLSIQNQQLKNQLEQKELEFKTLQDNLNIITQSFNVCRSMLIHIGEVMKVIEEQRQYIQSLVDSPAVQAHISDGANAQAG